MVPGLPTSWCNLPGNSTKTYRPLKLQRGTHFQVGAGTYLFLGQAELQDWAASVKDLAEPQDDPQDTLRLVQDQPGKPSFASGDC